MIRFAWRTHEPCVPTGQWWSRLIVQATFKSANGGALEIAIKKRAVLAGLLSVVLWGDK